MITQTIITLEQICTSFHIDPEIVRDFADFGLYPIILLNGETGIDYRHLDRVKKIISLHRTLGINKEGIDIILELREVISNLQAQVERLENETAKLKTHLGTDDPNILHDMDLLIEIDD